MNKLYHLDFSNVSVEELNIIFELDAFDVVYYMFLKTGSFKMLMSLNRSGRYNAHFLYLFDKYDKLNFNPKYLFRYDKHGNNIITYIMEIKNDTMIKRILKYDFHKYNVFEINKEFKNSCLLLACWYEQESIVKKLLCSIHYKDNVNKYNFSALMWAYINKLDTFNEMLKKIDCSTDFKIISAMSYNNAVNSTSSVLSNNYIPSIFTYAILRNDYKTHSNLIKLYIKHKRLNLLEEINLKEHINLLLTNKERYIIKMHNKIIKYGYIKNVDHLRNNIKINECLLCAIKCNDKHYINKYNIIANLCNKCSKIIQNQKVFLIT